MNIAIDFNAVRLAAAVLFFLTSVTVWIVLVRQHDRVTVALWSLGGLLFSLAMLSRVDTDLQVRSVFYVVSASLAAVGFVLRAVAMRRDLGLATNVLSVLAVCLLMTLPLAALAAWASAPAAVLFARASAGFMVAMLAFYSWQLGRKGPSRNGLLLSGVEALTCAAYLVIIVQLLLNWQDGLALKRWDYALFSLVGVINAAYSNLAYVGLVLDRSRVAESRAHDAQLLEVARRQAAEQGADELRAMLLQRDRLAAERGHLMQVLAHEIRQPLHNANAALHGAEQALRSPHQDGSVSGPDANRIAAERVQRARVVLGDMQSVLDNTLAVSSLLVREKALSLQEVEIDFLVDLALGDLPQAERARVTLQRETEMRIVEVEPGLVRLALRNLLRNAFSHGGPDVQVALHIEEQREPPAWVLSVRDNGPGLTPAQWQQVSPVSALAPPTVAGGVAPASAPADEAQPAKRKSGAGLFLVRRVMALHEGRLRLSAMAPQGLQASMIFPLPTDDEREETSLPGQIFVSGARKT